MSNECIDLDKIDLRCRGFTEMPAYPLERDKILETVILLTIRSIERYQAIRGLTNSVTLGNPPTTAPAHAFIFGRGLVGELQADSVSDEGSMPIHAPEDPSDISAVAREYLHDLWKSDPDALQKLLTDILEARVPPILQPGDAPADALTTLSLERPEQFTMSWTNFPPVFDDSQSLIDEFTASFDLTDPDRAASTFWPTLAKYGLPYYLLFAKKVDATEAERLRPIFGTSWTDAMDALVTEGALYAIDLTVFEVLAESEANGAPRFTPSTLTLLRQDPTSKSLTPICIRVAGHKGAGARIFSPSEATPSAWVYALQAAKTSVTVYGIYLGHVYQWHLVTAAMWMTAKNTLPNEHPLAQLLNPQAKYLIAFDTTLIYLFELIAPPTSINTVPQFLEVSNAFATGRNFFDDDPLDTLQRLGISEADFTAEKPWDAYPMVGQMLEIWQATERYITGFVEITYDSDTAVAADGPLQAWMLASGDPDGGNIRGLPPMNSRQALIRVLTSLIFRVTVHGTARLGPAANPGISFVGNFPPTLHNATIPEPSAPIGSIEELLSYMPKTGTIGRMVEFLFTFSFSVPYESFLPVDGLDQDLFFGPDPEDPRNVVLREFRSDVLEIYRGYAGENPPMGQWPRNIET